MEAEASCWATSCPTSRRIWRKFCEAGGSRSWRRLSWCESSSSAHCRGWTQGSRTDFTWCMTVVPVEVKSVSFSSICREPVQINSFSAALSWSLIRDAHPEQSVIECWSTWRVSDILLTGIRSRRPLVLSVKMTADLICVLKTNVTPFIYCRDLRQRSHCACCIREFFLSHVGVAQPCRARIRTDRAYRNSVCPFVCACIMLKRLNRTSCNQHMVGSLETPLFWSQRSWWNSNGVTPY